MFVLYRTCFYVFKDYEKEITSLYFRYKNIKHDISRCVTIYVFSYRYDGAFVNSLDF